MRNYFTVHFFFLILLFIFKMEIFGWGMDTHRLMTQNAIGALPEWEIKILDTYADSLFIVYCRYPDLYNNPEKYPGVKKEIEKYHKIPHIKGNVLHGQKSLHSNNVRDIYLFTYYLEQSINELRKNNIQDAARYMGVITHYVEDSNCPVHNTDNSLLVQLYPPPAQLKYFRAHRYIERPCIREFELGPYVPKKLGNSLYEAVRSIIPKFNQMRLEGRAQAIPILKGIYENDFEASNSARKKAILPAVKLLADMYHTIFCIAYNK